MKRTLFIMFVLAGCDRKAPSPGPAPAVRELSHAPVAEVTTDISEGMAMPESIAVDAVADVYLVSNINGDPHAADGNGYIARVAPDGTLLAPRWITGLHAPRGLAVDGQQIYAVDLDGVHVFDRATGAPRGFWALPDPHFPNDICVDADHHVWVTETGIHLGPAGAEPEGEGRVYRFDAPDQPTIVARGPALEGPNGIACTAQGPVIVAFMGKHVYRLVDGQPETFATLPWSRLDGIVELPDGAFLVTSWEARSIYRVMPEGRVSVALHDASLVEAASLDYDAKRQRLLVPLVGASQLRFEPYP
jgi:hypothetical protein